MKTRSEINKTYRLRKAGVIPPVIRKSGSERNKKWRYKKKFGISIEEYERMYLEQEGRCAICNKKFDLLCVDHRHFDGKVRGLLCNGCNVGIGFLLEDVNILSGAIEYIRKTNNR